MKYIILSVLLFGFTSCSVSNPPSEISKENTASGTSLEWIQDSTSGSLTTSGSENIDSSDNSGSTSEEARETGTISSGSGETRRDEEDVRTGTGVGKWDTETDDMSKDPEVQNIQKDIDAIFSDIEKGGK